VAPRAQTQDRYAEEMGALWTGLTRTLARLDRLAADPDQLEDDSAEHALRRLQYNLHLAAEETYGVEPPDGAETAHAELAHALGGARDTTAEVADAVADGDHDGVQLLLHEWRGALFRVRLARLRLAEPRARRPDTGEAPADGIARPLAAFLLALLGALAFVGGAVLGLPPLWAAGLACVCGSVLVYRP
jgi:hypothetical protein